MATWQPPWQKLSSPGESSLARGHAPSQSSGTQQPTYQTQEALFPQGQGS